MVRVRMKFGTPIFSPADYDYIMQCRDIEPRYKILKDLLDKYKTSSKRIYQIWRGEEANRVAWDQPIPYPQDSNSNQDINCLESETHGFATDTSSANKPDPTINVLHIESQPLDRDKVPLLCNNVPVGPAQSSKRTKTKRSKSDRVLNPPVISKDLTEKIDPEKLAHFRHTVKEGREELANLEYKTDET
ncbi:8019_t:CDS:1 [Diversispora eburnea]|uniref:8019_t:CDS:1 n=1 Tax=Diversispora eburnea TaxID=1213867 RepID=A0A9N9B7H5_9GLOM|nr:8019_t:CDS:1 [Diversispora eburnea]